LRWRCEGAYIASEGYLRCHADTAQQRRGRARGTFWGFLQLRIIRN